MNSDDENNDDEYGEDVNKITNMIDILTYNDNDADIESDEEAEDDFEEDIYMKYGISDDGSKFLLTNISGLWSK